MPDVSLQSLRRRIFPYRFWLSARNTIIFGRYIMNEQPQQQEQSGKQIAMGIIGFIVGTIVVLYLIKVLLL
jgi:hypothetical protein